MRRLGWVAAHLFAYGLAAGIALTLLILNGFAWQAAR